MPAEGMDPVWGAKSATDLASLATALKDVVTRVDRIRSQASGMWFGPDQQALANWYDSAGRPGLNKTVEMLELASKNLTSNARDQQDQTQTAARSYGRA